MSDATVTSKRRRTHAMRTNFTILCGTPRGNVTSIVLSATDVRFWEIVNCKKCIKLRHTASYPS